MIKLSKIAFLAYICIELVRAANEASYLDTSAEVNTTGYLFNIGTRRYVGIDPEKKLEAILLKDPKKAIKMRMYLQGRIQDAGFIFLNSNNIVLPEDPGKIPNITVLHSQVGLKTCIHNDEVTRVIFDKYDASHQFKYFLSPAVLLHENAFKIMTGNLCLGVDTDRNSLIATGCQDSPAKFRNYQLFSWVTSENYNHGMDATTHELEPKFDISKDSNPGEAGGCKKHGIFHLGKLHLTSPTNLPHKEPYQGENGRSEQPRACDS
ncbi:hypothetical protein NEMIN01_0543 [Nematocida minor]|uniref:uncharacterized protein n=1 Tax=Nematocida minor TaxID=1912983 RepID=UPI002220AC1A|nr:uncharacterized protein NEMIN01_0543 [Nematocida minor]KAI5189480.1 hypothetical protein NEMIN01_0543 [Nematocida minor]